MVQLQFLPDLSPEVITHDLFRLVAPGEISDDRIDRDIFLLRERFAHYAGTCPYGLWAPGLAITAEMRAFIDLYLPMSELRPVFRRLLSLSLKFPPLPTILDTAPSWLDVLQALQHAAWSDPSAFLQNIMFDEESRIASLFALFIPARHGGGFNRYPSQFKFLITWLKKKELLQQKERGVRFLDTACSTGESTYDLAMLLLENGLKPELFQIHGSTIEPLELFAAAHVFFPHQRRRQENFRSRVQPVFSSGANKSMLFFLEDITRCSAVRDDSYDVILCNGLLGGPTISRANDIDNIVAGLAARLRRGGIILVADRFHGGWKKRCPASLIHSIFLKHSLRLLDVDDGLVAEKTC